MTMELSVAEALSVAAELSVADGLVSSLIKGDVDADTSSDALTDGAGVSVAAGFGPPQAARAATRTSASNSKLIFFIGVFSPFNF